MRYTPRRRLGSSRTPLVDAVKLSELAHSLRQISESVPARAHGPDDVAHRFHHLARDRADTRQRLGIRLAIVPARQLAQDRDLERLAPMSSCRSVAMRARTRSTSKSRTSLHRWIAYAA